jgi:putative glutamine amidotransferase
MQVFNVALGGTMIPDVESAGYLSHSKEKGQMSDARHGIRVQQGTGLLSIVRSTQGEVNTNHHQAVERPGQGLRDTAYSPDGLIEGLEWQDPDDKPFLQLVQWHPERMADFENPLSGGLLRRFVSEVLASKGVQISSWL